MNGTGCLVVTVPWLFLCSLVQVLDPDMLFRGFIMEVLLGKVLDALGHECLCSRPTLASFLASCGS